MSDIIEPPAQEAPHSAEPAHPQAKTRRARRIPIIWIIPLVAIAIGGWLAWDTWSKKGPTITVSFESAEGLTAGQSQLRFKDIVFGTVQSFTLTPDNSRVIVTIATTREAEPLLTDQTVFWVVKPRLFAGNVSGLETVLSGSYIAMLPPEKPGKPKRNFVGREDPPVQEAHVPGRTFLIKANRLGSISVGSPVFFRDLDVGEVLGWDIADMAESVTIRTFVRAPYDAYVNDDTRFWNASGVSVKFGGGGVELQVESLRAILLGGMAFETPPQSHGRTTSVQNHVFPLFPDRDTADAASYNRKIPVISYFSGSVRGIAPGSEVTMHGLTIGRVTAVGLVYDGDRNDILAPVHYEIEPERILGVGTKAVFKTALEAADTMVKRGLRATLQSSNLLTGQQVVALEFIPSATPATARMEGTDVVLPASDAAGLSGLQTSATDLLNKLNAIPFAQIGASLNGILASANDLSRSTELRQTLAEAAGAVKEASAFVRELNTGTGPAFKQLPQVMMGLQKTMTNVDRLFLSLNTGYGDNTKFSRDLQRLIVQLNEAVRSFRSLADMLVQHPEAFIKGRPAGGLE
ncbi:intermembrane transport protein PqiB [Dongia soli]|uniref:MlaD family protein n=1 Tax=Dongia soli TaxID=600628 RepID=A0ABU5EGM1_9PROT|nr:MlaD family protein [Dongia soli]MDY0885482.1 MlaD family protein [Dongia soli]